MATARSVRMILIGDRTNTNFPDEIWQTGVSAVQSDAGGDLPGEIYTVLPSFTADVIGEASSNATWDMEWAWKGSSVFEQADQILLADACLAFWNAIRANSPTDMRMTGVRISAIDGTGKVINGANRFTLKTPVTGTGGVSAQLPPQNTIVLSLRTGRRGPGGRGRMFLPLTTISTTNGVVGSTARAAVANAGAAFMDAIWDVGVVPAVVNQAALRYSSVTLVDVGSIVDTQRRRRNQAAEVRTAATPTY